jgi:hypothetical protein
MGECGGGANPLNSFKKEALRAEHSPVSPASNPPQRVPPEGEK